LSRVVHPLRPSLIAMLQDGNLLTGQNPASAGPLAEKIIEVLSKA
jgi:putative intracellular protease/amidase